MIQGAAGPALELRSAGRKGLGVYAAEDISAGSVVLTFEGEPIPTARIVDFSHVIQVGRGIFLGPSGGIDDFVNHSCEPNCGLREAERGLLLFALRDVARGEELSFDYSTCILEEPPLRGCRCGSRHCRGVVRSFRNLSRSLRQRYRALGAVPTFVLGRARGVENRSGSPLRAPCRARRRAGGRRRLRLGARVPRPLR